MFVLLTKGDGIHARGFTPRRSVKLAAARSEVVIVTPIAEWPGVGKGIDAQQPIVIEHVETFDECESQFVAGRPADCVKRTPLHLLENRPDYVVSCINAGINTSRYTRNSGAVAAAARIAMRGFEQFAAMRPASESCIDVNAPALHSRVRCGVCACYPGALTGTSQSRHCVLNMWMNDY